MIIANLMGLKNFYCTFSVRTILSSQDLLQGHYSSSIKKSYLDISDIPKQFVSRTLTNSNKAAFPVGNGSLWHPKKFFFFNIK